jgi:hypothetical protein
MRNHTAKVHQVPMVAKRAAAADVINFQNQLKT